MHKKLIIGLFGLLLIVGGVYLAKNNNNRKPFPQTLRDSLNTAFAGYSDSVKETGNVVKVDIRAKQGKTEIVPGYTTDIWSYNETVPGPTIRIQKGDTLEATLINDLPQPTTIHWHGVRLDNGMDGVPDLTQDAVAPGEQFVYRFTPKDAGTYWFHPHVRGSEQLERGLYGVLIVEDPEEKQFDQDIVWVLDDWRLNQDASIAENFGNMHDVVHDGRWGNVITINGKVETDLALQPGEQVRLRLINAANARVFEPDFGSLSPMVIAVDGMLAKEPFNYKPMALAPGNRVDLIIEGPQTSKQDVRITDTFAQQDNQLATIMITGDPIRKEQATDSVLPKNQNVPTWNKDLQDITPDYTYELDLTSMGMMRASWLIDGERFGQDTPKLFEKDKIVIVRIQNNSGNLHPMHLHGQFFQVLARNGEIVEEPFFRDTVLLSAQDTVDIALMPQDRGKWAFHCHIQEHAEAGMMTSIIVE